MKYSKHGYKKNSKDKNNPYNVIPSGNITMKNVDFPVFGMDNLGNSRVMMPGGEYTFPGTSVFEIPLQNFPRHFQQGGSIPKFQDIGEVDDIMAQEKAMEEFKYNNWSRADGTVEPKTLYEKFPDKLQRIEKSVDDYLGNPSSTASRVFPGADNTHDSKRHAYAAALTADKVGFGAANLLGLAHEFGTSNIGSEHAIDIGNNFIGSLVGSVPFTDQEDHLKMTEWLSDNGWLFGDYQYGGSIPKAQFGWNDFEKSKIGKFVDAKGLRRDGEYMMNTIGDYFGYENTAEDARRMGLDASAMVNPVPDFINAYDHAQQGKLTDAALYATFGVLPFSAKPLVHGTKKAVKFFKEIGVKPVTNLVENAKQADIIDYNLTKQTTNNSLTDYKDFTFPIYKRDPNGVKGDILKKAAKNNERIISGSDYNTVFGQQYHFSGADNLKISNLETDPIKLQKHLSHDPAFEAGFAHEKKMGIAQHNGFEYEPFFFGASGNQHRGYGKNAYSYTFKPDAKIYNSWDVDITRITPKEFETLKNAGFDAVTSESRGLGLEEMIIINKNALKDFKGVDKSSIEYANLYDRNRHFVSKYKRELYIPKDASHPDFKTKHWDDIAETIRKDYFDKYGTYRTLPLDQYQYGGSLPKAQFGLGRGLKAINDQFGYSSWDEFEDSKVGKFIDATGLRQEKDFWMQKLGYEPGKEEKDLIMDGAAIFHPGVDFAHATTKFAEGEYTDAALYAGFGILPFGAGPLVRGTKKHIINPIKNTINKIKPKTVYNVAPTNPAVNAMEAGTYGTNIDPKTQKILDNNIWSTQNPIETTKYAMGDHNPNSIRKGLLTGDDVTLTEFKVRFPWLTGNVTTNKNILDLKKSQGVNPNRNEFLIPKNRGPLNKFLYPKVKTTNLKAIPEDLMNDPMFNPENFSVSYSSNNNFSKPYTYVGDQVRGATNTDFPFGFNEYVDYNNPAGFPVIQSGNKKASYFDDLVNSWTDKKGYDIYKRMYGGSLQTAQNGGDLIVPLQEEGKSQEIDAFGYKGYFDFNQEPINMGDDQDGHKGYLFVYTEGPTAGGSYWRPIENKYSGSRWEKSGQVEEYNAYFTNPNLIDEHWDKGSAVALKIKEAVKNNILYSELPEYLKDVNTWRTISPNRNLEKELKELDKKQTGNEISVSFDDLEKGIRHVESINGTLMKNKQSSASGYYGDLFDNITYDGTRDEFIADIDFQKKRFKQRYNGEIKDVPGLKSNGIDIYNEYKNQVDFTYTPTEIAALSNLLGRQGTRKYFGNVLRDGETLESVFPNLYGDERQLGADGKPLENKTPEQYIQKFKDAVNKKTGGEFVKKVKRLNQQLKKYNQGGVISPLAYQELVNLKMIKPKMVDGGSVQKEPHITQKGDSLSKIASKYKLSLSELLEYNPKYKNNPNNIGIGETIQLSDTPVQNNNTPNIVIDIKSGDTLSQIASKYGVRYQDIATLNNISDPRLIQPGQKIKLPGNASINKNNKNIKEQKKQAESVYVPEVSEINLNTNTVINEPWAKRVKDEQTGEWITIGKREKINSINKMDQADRIIKGMNDIEDGNNEKINYTIQKGDMLGVLASTNGISVKKLMEDNNISDARKIQAGQKIVINKPKGKPYIVVDEKAGRMHLYYPGNSEPSDSYPILSGVNPGDQQTKTVESFFKDGEKIDGKQLQKIMDENNFTEAGQVTSLPGYTSSVDWDEGNKSTGAGVYTIGTVNPNSGYIDESGQGRKSPSFVLLNAAGNAPGTVIHSTPSWNPKYKERRDALRTGQTSGDDGRFTSGCINGTCSAMIDLFENPDVGEGTQVFVLPEDKGNNFVYENGKINFYTSYDNDQKSKTYFTEDGEEKKNPLGLNETPSNKSGNYKPINIEFDKTFFQSNSKRFDGDVEGEEKEFTQNTKPFIESLTDNKKNMIDKLGIDGDTYNDLAMIAFGIYGYESGMGDENNVVENFSKFATKGAGAVTDKITGAIDDLHSNETLKIPKIGSLTSPDVESKFNTYGIDDLDSSVGWTQLRWTSLDPIEKKNLSKLNINENNYKEYAMDPAKSAELTIARLYGMHQKTLSAISQRNKKRNTNSLSDRDIKKYGTDIETYDAFNYLPKQWSPTSPGYTDFVNGYTKYINVTETDINDVDNGLIVKGEYSEDNPQFRERMRNKPVSEKIINADETLKYMVKDAKDIVNEKINQVSNWWDQVDLNPFYKLGGEFGINNQVQFYNDYINGLYKNTRQEKNANKMYDKLNRLYYNDSKQNNMHQLDIMKSIQSKG